MCMHWIKLYNGKFSTFHFWRNLTNNPLFDFGVTLKIICNLNWLKLSMQHKNMYMYMYQEDEIKLIHEHVHVHVYIVQYIYLHVLLLLLSLYFISIVISLECQYSVQAYGIHADFFLGQSVYNEIEKALLTDTLDIGVLGNAASVLFFLF